MKIDFNQENVNHFLKYDEETGKLFWQNREDRFNGKEAFTATDAYGYKVGSFFWKQVKAHRVIWLMKTGENPELIDHINQKRDDNRFENLREATKSLNARNSKIFDNNTSGVRGVSWNKREGKYRVYITHGDCKQKHICYADTLSEAKVARKAEEALWNV